MKITPGQSLAFMSFLQGVSGAYGKFSQARSTSRIARVNQRLAEMRARDALKRGEETEHRVRQRTKKVRGSQRAALAAQGIRLDTGSALDVQMEAENIGELDALTVKNNALREAFGFGAEARSIGLQGRLNAQALRNEGTQTLLSSGIRGLAYYKRFK